MENENKVSKFLRSFIAVNNTLSKLSVRFPLSIKVFRDDDNLIFKFIIEYKGG